jgi:hypothetical protein
MTWKDTDICPWRLKFENGTALTIYKRSTCPSHQADPDLDPIVSFVIVALWKKSAPQLYSPYCSSTAAIAHLQKQGHYLLALRVCRNAKQRTVGKHTCMHACTAARTHSPAGVTSAATSACFVCVFGCGFVRTRMSLAEEGEN